MRIAPFGTPVVPPVYCSSATSVLLGLGHVASSGWARATSPSHGRLPGAGAVIAARVARAVATGRRSISCLKRGSAVVRSTATTVSTPVWPATCCTTAADLSQTIATLAPWSASCTCSSSAV